MSESSIQSGAKRSGIHKVGDERVNSDAVDEIEEKTADILKFDIDCFEEAFDYLPHDELISVGKTCK